jgi:sugar/nucleoside kinase (ribokinase family)
VTLICCGGLRTDYIIPSRGEPRLNQMGGNALYAAAGARLWQRPTAILARIGQNYPQAWLAEMARLGFDTRGIRLIPGDQDHRTFYAYLDDNTRVDTEPAKHFARLGLPLPDALRGYIHSTPGQDDPHQYEPLAVTPDDLSAYMHARSAEPPPVGLHIAPISVRTQQLLPAAARRLGIAIVSADPGERAMRPALRPYIEEVLAQVDVFMPSAQEAEQFFADMPAVCTPKQRLRWFAARGPRIAVLKLGSAGALIYERTSDRFWVAPAVPVKVVDVTGAGDAFCGGFLAGLAGHCDPVRAAINGAVSASFAIEGYGPYPLLAAGAEEAQRRATMLSAQITLA